MVTLRALLSQLMEVIVLSIPWLSLVGIEHTYPRATGKTSAALSVVSRLANSASFTIKAPSGHTEPIPSSTSFFVITSGVISSALAKPVIANKATPPPMASPPILANGLGIFDSTAPIVQIAVALIIPPPIMAGISPNLSLAHLVLRSI